MDWPVLSARLAELHGRGETPKLIAAALDRDGYRPPKQAARFTPGMVQRLLHESGLRPHVRAIENELHRVLDVSFGEDSSRTTAGYAGANPGLVRRVAVSLLQQKPW